MKEGGGRNGKVGERQGGGEALMLGGQDPVCRGNEK